MLAPIMLWRVLANLTKVDASAILAYLRSLPAVKNQGAKSLRPERETDLIRHEDCAARRQVIHAVRTKSRSRRNWPRFAAEHMEEADLRIATSARALLPQLG
jgi:hypothetical protein